MLFLHPFWLFLKSFLNFSETRPPCRTARGRLPVVSGVTVWRAGVGSAGSRKRQCGAVLRLPGQRVERHGGSRPLPRWAPLRSSLVVPVVPDEVIVTQPSEKRKHEGNPPPGMTSLILRVCTKCELHLFPGKQEAFFFSFFFPPPHGDEKLKVRNEPPEGSWRTKYDVF